MKVTNKELFSSAEFMMRLASSLQKHIQGPEDFNVENLEKMVIEEFSSNLNSKSVAEDILKMNEFSLNSSEEELETHLRNKWFGKDKVYLLINDIQSGKKDLSNLSSKEYKMIVNKFIEVRDERLNYKQHVLFIFFNFYDEAIIRFANALNDSVLSEMAAFRDNIKKFAIKLNYDIEKGVFYE